jgi:uncharacterized protein
MITIFTGKKKMIFIDTGPFIAKYVQKDHFHDEALEKWAAIANRKLFISNHILDEIITLLSRKTSHLFALDKGRRILASPAITILRTDAEDEFKAITLFEKYADKRVTFTDCLSLALIHRYRLRSVFTFDGHFRFFKVEVL